MFTVLEADHREVKSMLAQLQAPACAAARPAAQGRKKMVERLVIRGRPRVR
jgi:hypothetical protein